MSLAEIVQDIRKLSLADQRELDRALQEVIEDAEDLADAQESLGTDDGTRYSLEQIKAECCLPAFAAGDLPQRAPWAVP